MTIKARPLREAELTDFFGGGKPEVQWGLKAVVFNRDASSEHMATAQGRSEA
jgi:hypothetical protein